MLESIIISILIGSFSYMMIVSYMAHKEIFHFYAKFINYLQRKLPVWVSNPIGGCVKCTAILISIIYNSLHFTDVFTFIMLVSFSGFVAYKLEQNG